MEAMYNICSHISVSRNDVHAMPLHFYQLGSTALIEAASRGDTQIVEMLLSHPDIDANLQDKVAFYCIIGTCTTVTNFYGIYLKNHILF